MLTTSTVALGSIGFAFGGNTGDHALLLNDASRVAGTLDGGTLTFEYRGLDSGTYHVFTYAANVSGAAVNTPVRIPEATGAMTQIVTEPMPGNSFGYLITHSIHEIDLLTGEPLHVTVTQPPNIQNAMHINGFQIVMVPEPGTFGIVAAASMLVLIRRARGQVVDGLVARREKG